MIRTQVYLPEDLYKKITLVAKKEKKSSAQVVRDALEKGLSIGADCDDVGDALLKLAQVHAKGSRDLSQRIDAYLYEE
ncbi:MAG: ribbon-helix-helix protein, CopG family [Patescibacteria group bacterium]|nr:ribbon-helix-helix protein, CopG family [Patescibacteria group bacterium]